ELLMGGDGFDGRAGGTRPLGMWTMLFRGFQVALDWKKLLLAAGGIVTMAVAWWLLAMIFGGPDNPPAWPRDYPVDQYLKSGETEKDAERRAWEAFKRDRNQWNLRHKAAGNPDVPHYTDTGDVAQSPEEYAEINDRVLKAVEEARRTGRPQLLILSGDRRVAIDRKPAGQLRAWPWFEDRGPNPYLMVTGQAGRPDADGTPRYAPWDRGQFFDWFTTKQ